MNCHDCLKAARRTAFLALRAQFKLPEPKLAPGEAAGGRCEEFVTLHHKSVQHTVYALILFERKRVCHTPKLICSPLSQDRG